MRNKLLKNIIKEELDKINEDGYQGEHKAPNKNNVADGSAAPLYDLTKIYPDDFYSNKGAYYYGDNRGDSRDSSSMSIIMSARNKPNYPVKIYRAVPNINKEHDDKLKSLTDIVNYYNKFKFFPLKNKIVYSLDDKYDSIENYDEKQKKILDDIINQISELNSVKLDKLTINDGDWVTINREYAKEHGESNLNNNYKILTKNVKASQLFTGGDSIHEWGYSI